MQLPLNQAENVKIAAQISEVVVKASYASSLAVTIYTGALSQIWAMINEMQLLAYIFYMNIYIPGNAQMFFDFLIEISEFRLFDTSQYSYEFVHKLYIIYKQLVGEEIKTEHKGRHMRIRRKQKSKENSFKTKEEEEDDEQIFHQRIAPMLLQIIVLIISAVLFLILGIWQVFDRQVRPYWLSMNYAVFWNSTLRLYFESYLPLGHLYMWDLQDGYKSSSSLFTLKNLESIFELILITCAPYIIYRYLKSNQHRFTEPIFRRRFGDTTNILNHRNPLATRYILIFCYRRFLFIIWIVFVEKSYWQVLLSIYTVQFTLIALGPTEPFHSPAQRKLETFNELILLLWCYHMIIFTDFVPDPEIRYQAGYFLVYIVGFCLVVNLAYLHFPVFNSIYSRCKKVYLKYCAPKRRPKVKLTQVPKAPEIPAPQSQLEPIQELDNEDLSASEETQNGRKKDRLAILKQRELDMQNRYAESARRARAAIASMSDPSPS